MSKKIKLSYDYSGWESCSKRDHVASVALMEEAIENFDSAATVKVKDDKNNFCGKIVIESPKIGEEEFEAEDYLDYVQGYCEAGYDNYLGEYYEIEII